MQIVFTRLSDSAHRVMVIRADGSRDSLELNSRSFLRHDFAHFAVESSVPLARGFWGAVAAGAPLTGPSPTAALMQAESLAGPVQTLMRTGGDEAAFLSLLKRRWPDLASAELARCIRETGRRLEGHWRATPRGGDMLIEWDETWSSP